MLNVQSLNTYRISHVPNPSPPSVSVFRASKLELILGTFHVPSPPSFCMTCKHVSQGSLPQLSRPSVLGNPLGPCLFLAHKIGPFFKVKTSWIVVPELQAHLKQIEQIRVLRFWYLLRYNVIVRKRDFNRRH